MHRIRLWWGHGLSPWVKLTYLVLLANAVPAFIILTSVPAQTQSWFVWTIKPPISARLLGVMYFNALLLVAIGCTRATWAEARITVVVITTFSTAATLVTIFNIGPFLLHPWYHLAYWLSMYAVLFVISPYVLWQQQRRFDLMHSRASPLSRRARVVAALELGVAGLLGVGLLVSPPTVSLLWPWNLTPLVGRMLGVWFTSLAVAYAWALRDGDWRRTWPIFWQAVPTGLLLAVLPLLHRGDVRAGAPGSIALYLALALATTTGGCLAAWSARTARLARQVRGDS